MATVRVVFQEAMARGHLVGDEGDQVFMICKAGLERELGVQFRRGDEAIVEFRATFVRYARKARRTRRGLGSAALLAARLPLRRAKKLLRRLRECGRRRRGG